MNNHNNLEKFIQCIIKLEPEIYHGLQARICIDNWDIKLNPFAFWIHEYGKKQQNYPDHPHRNMEGFIYVLDGGACQHEDSLGDKQIINPGDLVYINAATGIVHSDKPVHPNKILNMLILWVYLEKECRTCEPTCIQLVKDQIPVVEQDGMVIKILAGSYNNIHSLITPVNSINYYDIYVKAGKAFTYEIPIGWNSALLILEGYGYLGSSKRKICSSDMVMFKKDNGNMIIIEAGNNDLRFMLLAGKPVDEEFYRVKSWVGTTEEELSKCDEDYTSCQNGFEKCKGWQSQFSSTLNE